MPQGSTRTVSGGDAFDAVQWLFGNDNIMVCLDSSQSDPLHISVQRDIIGTGPDDKDEVTDGVRARKLLPIAKVVTKNYFKLMPLSDDGDSGSVVAWVTAEFECDFSAEHGCSAGQVRVTLHR